MAMQNNPGGNVLQSLKDGFKDLGKVVGPMVADTLGPMALLAIGAQKFVDASREAALNVERIQSALAASEGAAKLRKQFETLLGSAQAARAQVEMLAKVASTGAFSFDSIGEASKNLTALTSGALGSEKALRQVQDAAAATGAPVDAMATAVGDLYEVLKKAGETDVFIGRGRGLEGAADQLKRMGVLSDAAIAKLKGLTAAGASVASTWSIVEAELKKSEGAAAQLGTTIAGLRQQLANMAKASDTRLGELFLEGEKAGLRAALGFAKLNQVIEEANAGPWAAYQETINRVKEFLGGLAAAFAESGAAAGIFQAVSKVAVGVLLALQVALLASIPLLLKLGGTILGAVAVGLGKVAAAAGLTTAVLGRMLIAMRAFAFNPVTVALTGIAAAALFMADNILKASSSVKDLAEELKAAAEERERFTRTMMADVATVSSPEERDTIAKKIRERMVVSKQNEDRAREVIQQSDAVLNDIGPLGIPNTSIAAREAALSNKQQAQSALDAERANQATLQQGLDDLLSSEVGPDQKLLEISQKRVELEREIARAANERLQALVSPGAAVEMANQNMQRAQAEFEYAESATRNRYDDEQKLTRASAAFDKSKGAREQSYADAARRDDLLKRFKEYAPQLLGDEEPAFLAVGDRIDRAAAQAALQKGELSGFAEQTLLDSGRFTEKDLADFKQLSQKGKTPAPGLDFGAFDTGAASESGRLQAEIAKRTAFVTEVRDAISDKDTNRGLRRLEAVRAEMVKSGVLEGDEKAARLQSELGTVAAGSDRAQEIQRELGQMALDKIKTSMPQLQSELQAASEKENVVNKQAALEEARVQQQAAKVAAEAARQELEAAKTRLQVERQIEALKGGSDRDAQRAIERGYEDETDRISRKRSALEAFDTAATTYNALNQSDAARSLPGDPDQDTPEQKALRERLEALRQAMEAAQLTAVGAGVRQGDTLEGYDLEQEQAAAARRTQAQALAESTAARQGRAREDLAEAGRARTTRTTSAGERAVATAAEGVARMQTIAQAEAAAQRLQAANAQADAPAAEAAKTELAALGFAGKGLEEIQEMKRIEMELLEVKKQQAAVDLASAAARKQAAMEELQYAQQRTQLTLAQAAGDRAGTTAREIEREENRTKQARAESAVPLAQEKELLTMEATALNEAANIAEKEGRTEEAAALRSEAEQITARRDALEQQVAALGYGGQSADDIETDRNALQQKGRDLEAQRLADRDAATRAALLETARVREEYAPDQASYEAARDQRKRIEDESFRRDKVREYTDAGYTEDEAARLAEKDTEANRLRADLDEMGKPQVDDLTRLGGNASKSGIFLPGMDKQERLINLAEEQNRILEDIMKQNEGQIQMARAESVRGI